MFCKKCGNKINDNMKFCNICGEKLAGTDAKEIIHNEKCSNKKYNMGLFLCCAIVTALLVGAGAFGIMAGLKATSESEKKNAQTVSEESKEKNQNESKTEEHKEETKGSDDSEKIVVNSVDENNTKENTSQVASSEYSTTSTSEFRYRTYQNSKYGYSINYPDILTTQTTMSDNSGIIMESDSEGVILTLEGYNNTSNSSIDARYNQRVSVSEGITYKYCNKSMFVVTGRKSDGTSYYYYEAVGQGSINDFMFTWPTEKVQYEKVAENLYNTFKTPNTAKSWY